MPSPHLGSIPQVHPSRQSTPSSTSKISLRFYSPKPRALNVDYSVAPLFLGKTRRQSWPDPYEDLGAEKFSQFMGPPNQPGNSFRDALSLSLFICCDFFQIAS